MLRSLGLAILFSNSLLMFPSSVNSQEFTGVENEACENQGFFFNVTYSQCSLRSKHELICFGRVEDTLEWRLEDVHTLIVCQWSRMTLDPQDTLQGYSFLRKLVIANGNLTKLTSPFPPEARLLEEIKITGTKLSKLPTGFLSSLPSLKILDLRNNSIKDIVPGFIELSSLRQIYLSGNPLRCTENLTWLLTPEEGSFASRIADKDELRCSTPYQGRPFIPVLEIIRALREECKRTVCECELVYVMAGRAGKQVQKQLMAFVEVNCSHRGLTEMPGFLPANTTTLRLTGNKIKNLSPVATNPSYRSVVDLYLEENLIESIVELEGSRWLDNFRLLNLRGNRLTDLPTYALENVLRYSGNAASLYLGRNPWRCDCIFTPSFQDLLISYTNLMKDIDDVRCATLKGDDNSDKHIRDLTRSEICLSSDEEPLLHPLDVLSIILALLILLMLGKLLYDYWSFKKTGKLPWIVAKIP